MSDTPYADPACQGPGHDRDRAPASETPSCTAAGSTVADGPDIGDLVDDQALAPLVELLLELRPGLPVTIAESLVREALDGCADLILDAEWAKARVEMYPVALSVAAGSRWTAYAARRAAETTRARVCRPGEFHGRVACCCLECSCTRALSEVA